MHTLERTHPFTMERNTGSQATMMNGGLMFHGTGSQMWTVVSPWVNCNAWGCFSCQDQGQDHSLLPSRVVGGGQGNSTLNNLEDKQVIPTEGQCQRPLQKGHLSSSYSTNRPDHKDWKEVEFIPPLTQILRLHRCPA